MKIVGNISLDSLTGDLSGALWIFARLREDGSAATSTHRCIQREVWREVNFGDRVVKWMALLLAPFVLAGLVAVFTTINGRAIRNGRGRAFSARSVNR